MFGSDFRDQLSEGIDAILSADFLTAEQKADILCNNAARYLRLGTSEGRAVGADPKHVRHNLFG